MDDNIRVSWERFLNPEILRTNLIVVSLFITAFELLKDSIIGRIRDFFTNGFDENEWIIDDKYKTEVLSKNKSPLYASLAWLKDMNVITDNDIKKFNKIKKCRNELVHEIIGYISKGPKNPLPLFSEMIELLHKIEKWWILNVEIPTNPDLNGRQIDDEGIIPGKIMTLRLLLDIALGTENESKFYYHEFIKRKKDI
ncbi:MAG TPA: hypothetical protein EYP21_03780 [Syntrophaceae bacterium]|nr:hypothetical protein [Syntrophaceae bacterium]